MVSPFSCRIIIFVSHLKELKFQSEGKVNSSFWKDVSGDWYSWLPGVSSISTYKYLKRSFLNVLRTRCDGKTGRERAHDSTCTNRIQRRQFYGPHAHREVYTKNVLIFMIQNTGENTETSVCMPDLCWDTRGCIPYITLQLSTFKTHFCVNRLCLPDATKFMEE